ncbi:MAG: hypothetical protein E7157_00420 [Lactobacillales bacterium]|nr:hypothetical protein [Lactobacillales bacterium]
MEKMKNEQPKVIFIDPENKLYKIGFQDGYEKTNRNIENNLPTDIEFLNPRGPEEYVRGFIDGSEKAVNELNNDQQKTR